jgi:hypothetical protein
VWYAIDPVNPDQYLNLRGLVSEAAYQSSAGAPVASLDIRLYWPFHQLPPFGDGKCLNGEKNLGYNITFQNAQMKEFRTKSIMKVPR